MYRDEKLLQLEWLRKLTFRGGAVVAGGMKNNPQRKNGSLSRRGLFVLWMVVRKVR